MAVQMTDFVPPKPQTLPRKASWLRRLHKARHCSLATLYDRSYSMKMGDIWTPFKMLYFVNQPELVNRVLVKEAERFPKSRYMRSMLTYLLGDGIFVSNGELWKKQRRMMDPAFNQARIQDVFPLMLDATQAMGERLRGHAEGDVLAIDEETTHVTADIIFRTIYSRALRRDEADRIFRAFDQYQETAHRQGFWAMAGVPTVLSLGRRLARRHARTIRGLLERGVDRRIDELNGKPDTGHKDILASLLEAVDPVTGAKFSRKELVDQIAVMFLAGHETSASSLAWALYLIAMRPDIQDRMHSEAAAVFGDRPPDFSDIKRLKLARDVFRETLRLYPPVSFIGRANVETEKMRDKVMKPGSIIFVSPWLIQRHRKLWKKPDVFDPDRFSDPATKESIRNAYIPFSAGPRVCLGASFAMQEGTLILAYLARHFRFEPVEGHTPKPISRLTLRSENGVRLRVFRRTAASGHASPDSAHAENRRDEEPVAAGCPYHHGQAR